MDTATDILVEAGRLALKAGIQWWAVVAMLLVLAAVRVLGPRIHIPGDPDWNKPKPDATWGDNVKPDDGPPGGGMEGG